MDRERYYYYVARVDDERRVTFWYCALLLRAGCLYLVLSLLIRCFEALVEPVTRQAGLGFGTCDRRGIERSFNRARLSLQACESFVHTLATLKLACYFVEAF